MINSVSVCTHGQTAEIAWLIITHIVQLSHGAQEGSCLTLFVICLVSFYFIIVIVKFTKDQINN